MNNRGQIFLGIIFAIVIFIMGVMFMPLAKDAIGSVRVHLNCSSVSTITAGNMLTCLITDASFPYFVWLIISAAIGMIIGRIK